MIRLIAAIDAKRGLGNGQDQPFHIKADLDHFRGLTWGQNILMGYTTYRIIGALEGRTNFVAKRAEADFKLPDAQVVTDLAEFLSSSTEDVWVIGGGAIFAASLEAANELYLTRVEGDFNCSVFFPEFESRFYLASQGDSQAENNINFRYEVWKRLPKQG